MGFKPQYRSEVVIDDEAVFYTGAIEMLTGRSASYVVRSPDNVTLAYEVEVSNATEGQLAIEDDAWVPYGLVSIDDTTGEDTFGIELLDLSFRRARLKVTATGLTGTPTLVVEATIKAA